MIAHESRLDVPVEVPAGGLCTRCGVYRTLVEVDGKYARREVHESYVLFFLDEWRGHCAEHAGTPA